MQKVCKMYRPFFGHLCKSFSVFMPAATVNSHTNSHVGFNNVCVSVGSATLVAIFVFFESLDCKMSLMSFSLAFPNLEVNELATDILLVRPNYKQTDDNVTSRKSCFPFEARNGLFTEEQ